MTAEQSTSRDLLNGFIKTSQYLIGLPDDADICWEAPKALINFFKADISFVVSRHHQKATIGPFCLSLEQQDCKNAAKACSQLSDEVMRDGFLASEMVDLPERHAMVFLPVNHDNQVVAVLAVGHCQNVPFDRKELNTYLGVASLLESIVGKKISEQRFQLMADNVPEMLFRIAVQTDSTKNFDYVSKGSFHVLGCSPEELKSTPLLFFENLREGDALSLGKQIMEAADRGQRFMRTVHWQSPEGSGKVIELNAQAIQEEDGTIYVDGAAQDITEQRNLEQQLHQTQKMSAIGTLAGGIAHDFNNLLTPILGYADMLLYTLPPHSDEAKDISKIFQAGNRAKDLVKQILTFSRKSGQEHRPLQIQSITKEAIKLLRSSIPVTIDIKQDIDPLCPAVMADPTQIHQVVMNLCTNAYHAMQEIGGTLTLSLAQVAIESDAIHANKADLTPGNYVRLKVSDTGHGMSPETRERIFEPYFTTKEIGDGTGLGLAVVHGIVSSCGGTISVDSEPGHGCAIYVFFPVIGSETEKTEDINETQTLPTGEAHILVVDDSEAVTQLEQKMLETLGYSVTICTCPKKALAIFRARPTDFDLLLTDMTMPGMTGTQLASEIFSIRPKMPVILCTGFSELISEERAKALGIKAYIMKPIMQKDLARAVHKTLYRDQS